MQIQTAEIFNKDELMQRAMGDTAFCRELVYTFLEWKRLPDDAQPFH